jgi:hypothetical protein
MRVAQAAHARAHTTGHACRAPAWTPRTGRGIHAPREEAPGGVASVAHAREAHPSPDWLHGPPALVHAVAGPLAATARAAPKAISAAPAPLERLPPPSRRTEDEPQKRGPGRSPQAPGRLEPAAPAFDAAWRAPARLAAPRAPVQARLRGRGPEDPGVARERGGRRHGRRLAAAIQEPSEPRRPVAQPAGRSPTCLERLEPAERVLPTRRATLECVARDVPPPVALAMPATRLPSEDRARLAETRTVEGGTPLRAIAERLRTPLFEPGSVCSALRPAAHQQRCTEVQRRATVWQRSSAHGEGRTGSWSLRSQQRRGLALPRQRACFTTMHHVFLTRPDGTTAAQRFFGQKPRTMVAAIVASVALAPAPLRPPRKS